MDGEFDAGRYVYRFDGTGLSSGVCYRVMKAGKFVDMKKDDVSEEKFCFGSEIG